MYMHVSVEINVTYYFTMRDENKSGNVTYVAMWNKSKCGSVTSVTIVTSAPYKM